jgi:hypothetical protein
MNVQSQQQHPKIRLKTVPTSFRGPAVSAPPVLIASTHTIDYGCGICGAVLMHAEAGQVHNLVIHCTLCGNYSTTDA